MPLTPHSESEPSRIEHAATQLGRDFVAADPWIGRQVDGRYRILRKLAEGGMGVVYVAEHLALRKEVAFKLVRGEYADNEEVIARFAREALATAQFEHPHVVGAIDYGSLPEGGAYFVMQLVRGTSLRQLLNDKDKLPFRRACSVGAQIADALSAAHSSGVIHRDLKPENILVESRDDGSDLVKILDFGIARIEAGLDDAVIEAARPGQALTRVGVVMGTPGYMAPEQALGAEVDHRTDLYALGVVLWESITGRELWTGDDFTSLVARQMHDQAPSLGSASDQAFPEELEQLVQRLLARSVEDRPPTAGEVRDALRSLSLSPRGPGPAIRAVEQQALRTLSSVRKRTSGWLERMPGLQRALVRTRRSFHTTIGGPFKKLPLGQQLAYILAATALPLSLWLVPGGPNSSAPTADHAGTPEAKVVAAAPEEPSSEKRRPDSEDGRHDATEEASQIEEAAGRKAKNVVETVVTAAVDALRREKPTPKALQKAQETLFANERLRRRRLAARQILKYEPREDVPKYVVVVAQLESERNCAGRRAALAAIAELKDPRTRQSVERYHDSRSGCGIFGTVDCYECNRRDLQKTLDALRE